MPAAPAGRPLRALFVCTGNSARSQMAEAVMNARSRGRIVAASAGSAPATRVHPLALAALEAHGYAWSGHPPQGLDAVMGQPWDLVITVCDRARESCPVLPGQPAVAHWGMPDPAEATGTEAERQRAFDDALRLVTRRIELLLALPVEQLKRLALESEAEVIGDS
ncbi:MAG TPA: arsenate reductase ArsC [Gemmatimonadales bacterium]|nr:arsenate reductase ArsC [Gemmatimonadales bacterium]